VPGGFVEIAFFLQGGGYLEENGGGGGLFRFGRRLPAEKQKERGRFMALSGSQQKGSCVPGTRKTDCLVPGL